LRPANSDTVRATTPQADTQGEGRLKSLDQWLNRLLHMAKWLVIPVVVLLFLQWPLRDGVQAYSREANDLGQILFAFYVALAVTSASRSRSHIAVESLAQRYSPEIRDHLHRLCSALILIPWAGFIIWAGRPIVINATLQLERFQDTANPGYFLIKIAVWVLAAGVLAAGCVDVVRGRGERP
jgi:TRAP-type mannitol/chloroaromatic compound transport system permease small subunit